METNESSFLRPFLFTAGELAGIVGGTCRGNLDAKIYSVSTDSRFVKPDGLFVAFEGERTDGHYFIQEAIQKGAHAIIANIKKKNLVLESLRDVENAENVGIILVDSTLTALQEAAEEYRLRNSLLRIGVTGSSGKTTTKECIGAILSACYPPETVVISPGNLNSDIGLACAIFDIQAHHRIGVFEMGINRKGEMDELASMYAPDIAVITNIGTAHVGIFGSREEIAHEKSKIFSHFDGKQHAIIWEDDDFRSFLAAKVRGTIHYFGLKSTEGLGLIKNRGIQGWDIEWKGQHIECALPGRHNLLNVCAALSVAHLLNLEAECVAKGLSSVTPVQGRSQIREGKITVIQDYYNANPESMASAIEFFSEMPVMGRKIMVLGSMLELGERSIQEHERIARFVAQAKPSAIFLFGEEMEVAATILTSIRFEGDLFFHTHFEELAHSVLEYVQEGDALLIKGSRGMAMERLVEKLEKKGLLASSSPNLGGPHAS
jgi:UDP-N-acetylmuramoyl-tripeptide--D-alanyl-D-alanine ligase